MGHQVNKKGNPSISTLRTANLRRISIQAPRFLMSVYDNVRIMYVFPFSIINNAVKFKHKEIGPAAAHRDLPQASWPIGHPLYAVESANSRATSLLRQFGPRIRTLAIGSHRKLGVIRVKFKESP